MSENVNDMYKILLHGIGWSFNVSLWPILVIRCSWVQTISLLIECEWWCYLAYIMRNEKHLESNLECG